MYVEDSWEKNIQPLLSYLSYMVSFECNPIYAKMSKIEQIHLMAVMLGMSKMLKMSKIDQIHLRAVMLCMSKMSKMGKEHTELLSYSFECNPM